MMANRKPQELFDALKEAVELQIEYELACQEEDSEGYRESAFSERKAAEAAWERLRQILQQGEEG